MLSEVKHLKNVDLIMLMTDFLDEIILLNKNKKESEPFLKLGGYHR
jgi:hypothetical protein